VWVHLVGDQRDYRIDSRGSLGEGTKYEERMSDDELGLLRTIADSPTSDAPRLVYADWLDDHGQPIRAEFIRLQIEIASLDGESQPVRNGYVHLWKRQQELLDHHAFELNGPLASLAVGERIIHERGFVSEIEFTVETFLDHAEEIARLMPTPHVVRVTHAMRRVGELTCHPHINQITHIVGLIHGAEMIDSDVVGRLLDVRDSGDFANHAVFPARLRELDVEGCGIHDGHIVLLNAIYPRLPQLEVLDLSHNAITDIGVSAFLDTTLPQKLRRVILGGNPIANQGAIELADRWPRNSPLENLNLRLTNITSDGHRALTARFGGIVDLF
jgi:uncharacterized protein (TIGR02996 family)